MAPVRDALVYREVSADGSVWDVKRIGQHRVAAHVEGGWTILVTSDQLRATAIAIAYEAEIKRRPPFNPPR